MVAVGLAAGQRSERLENSLGTPATIYKTRLSGFAWLSDSVVVDLLNIVSKDSECLASAIKNRIPLGFLSVPIGSTKSIWFLSIPNAIHTAWFSGFGDEGGDEAAGWKRKAL